MAPELSRYLFLAGAVPYLFLGAAHARATPLRADQRAGLSPADPELAAAMTRTWPRLTRRTTMWLTWVGFNLSHSLGALAFGAFVVVIGRSAASYAGQAAACAPLATLIAAAYVGLAVKYWFRIPIVGCVASLVLFAAAWAALLAQAPAP
jgi:hypothetical protein